MSQCEGAQLLRVDVIGGDGQLPGVVEEVVEQDLRGQHRQEGQHQGGSGRAEHVAEVAGGAHQDVLDGVGEDPAALGDPVGEDVEVLLQEQDVGRVLGHVGRGVHGQPHIGGVQGQRVVHPVAQEPDGPAPAPQRPYDPGLVLGRDTGEDGGGPGRPGQLLVVQLPDVPAGQGPAGRQAEVGADLLRDERVVARTYFDRDAEVRQAFKRGGGTGLGRVEEDQEAGQAQPVLVGGGEERLPVRVRGGHGDDPAARREVLLEHHRGLLRYVTAAGQDRLGCPLATSRRLPSARSTSAEPSCRSWSKGSSASRW